MVNKYILLLHGMGGPNPLNNIQVGLENDYQVLKPIMPGFTEADGYIQYSDTEYINYIEEIRENRDINEWIVVGYSMGGRTALNYTIKYPEKVEKLIIIDSVGIDYMMPLLKFSWGKTLMKTLLYPLLKYSIVQDVLGKNEFKHVNSKEYKIGKKWMSDMMGSSIIRKNFVEILTTIGRPIENLNENLSKIENRTLILWAENDSTALVRSGYELNNMIKNSNIFILPKYGHMAPMEKTEFYINHILEFIR